MHNFWKCNRDQTHGKSPPKSAVQGETEYCDQVDFKPPYLLALENRLLFDANPMADDGEQPAPLTTENLLELLAGSDSTEPIDWLALPEFTATTDAGMDATQELIAIDSHVENLEQLVADLRAQQAAGRDIDILIIDQVQDGLDQLTTALADYSRLESLYIVGHGNQDGVQLGNQWLTANEISDRSSQLADWRSAFTTDADIVFYGCNLASSGAGQTMLDVFARATGTDVAASDDLTGHATLGGDWDLEFRVGQVDTAGLFSVDAQADWHGLLDLTAQGNESLVNQGTSGSQSTTPYNGGNVAMDDSGNYVVVWDDWRNGSHSDIYARVYNADGTAHTSEFLVHSASASIQDWSNVAMADDGKFVVTWSDNQSGTYEVYMRLFDFDGNALTAETQVSTLSGAQDFHSVDFAADGSFVVSFYSANADNVYFQRFNATGSAVGSNTIVNTTTANIQNSPDVAVADDGRFIVVWESLNQDGSGYGVYGQRFNASGVAQGSEFQVNTTTLNNQWSATVAMDASANFVVAWESQGQDGSGYGIYAQRYDASGAALGGEIAVNTTTSLDQRYEHIDLNGNGDFVISWHSSNQDGSGLGVYAQQFASDGTRIGGEVLVNTTTNNAQQDSTVAYAGNNVVIVWSGEGSGDALGTFAQRFAATDYATLTVTTTSDTSDGDTSSIAALIANQGADGFISLREAISATNNSTNGASPDQILFDISGAGPHTITVTAPLPSITDALVIDGWSEPDYSSTPVIVIDGNGVLSDGLVLTSTADGSTIRGLVIRDFGGDGIEVQANSDGNTIVGNYIGRLTNAGADAGAGEGNSGNGILIQSTNNTVGGTVVGYGNVLSGNGDCGITITGASAIGNIVVGNFIGTNAAGTSAIGNSIDGILIDQNAASNTIGGATATERNVISGNLDDGIEFDNSANNNIIQGNYIGTNVNGTGDLGNLSDGILLNGSSANNEIGGTADGAGNVIAFNDQFGINLESDVGIGNSILRNSIFDNALLGIDINSDGVTANDVGDGDLGPNSLQNFPALINAMTTGSQIVILGTLNSTANSYFRVEFFASTTADGSGNGEGERYLGFANIATDGSGNATINATLTATVAVGEFITATATKSEVTFGTFTDTSEFGGNIACTSNSAPVLDPSKSPTLASINEDAGAPVGAVGTLISALIDFANPAGQVDNITDADPGALLGIAITAANTTSGTWFYSTNNGSSWSVLGSVSASSARLLAADANTRVYFQPTSNYNGSIADAITFRAWDQTTGTNGSLADTSTSGGTTAFSTDTDTASLVVTSVNDEQVLATNTGMAIAENGTGATITNAMLQTTDIDNATSQIVYTITTAPANGTLYRGAVALAATDTFTQADIDSGLLTYSHNGSETSSDSFAFSVDDGTGSATTGTFNVTITPVNDNAPLITSNGGGATAAINVAENATSVTTATATDGDLPAQTLSYSISGADAALFSIDSSSGQLSFIAAPNRESPTDSNGDNIYEVTVQVSDGTLTDSQAISVSVTDVDEFDVGPVSDIDGTANAVDENAANGTAVGVTAAANDADATTNTITYSLDNSAGGRFAVDSSNGIVTVANGALLNRESAASHNITVRATSADGSFSTQSFTVNVNDVDEFDVGAVSDVNAAANTVTENAANGATVGITASASDADATSNAITYSLDDDAGGRFAIDNTTGVVSVANGSLLDYESATGHDIVVRAASADGSFSTQLFTILLTDANEGGVSLISDRDAASDQVTENAAGGTLIGVTAYASDPDGTDFVTYSLDDDAGGRFSIDANTGVVRVAGAIDREAAASYSIVVRATSTDTSSVTQAFTVNIGDIDEYDVGPIIDSDAATDLVDENAANGSVVGIIGSASDPDATTNVVTYSLDDDAGGRFAIDAVTGEVTVANGGLLDREIANSHSITIRATSADGSVSTQSFSIGINDVDEFDVGAVVDVDPSLSTVAEDAALGSTVGITAFATDADATTSAISYSLDDSAGGRFAIDGSTGIVTINAALDFETGVAHAITVRATSADGSFATQVFGITVTDVNESGVTPISDTDGSADFVLENALPGTSVGITAFADDADGTDVINYSFDDDAGGRFAIDALTGEITVAGGLDREAAASHDVVVRATSTDTSTVTRTFTISIGDVDEFDVGSPMDIDPAANAVDENSANGTTVGVTALAIDLDALLNGVTYSLVDDAGGRFAIDANTGVVSVAAGLDYEAAASHDITIRATSADGSTADQIVTIGVNDVNETPTDIAPNGFAVDENRDTSSGFSLGVLSAADVDSGDMETYSIQGGPDATKFSIGGANGNELIFNDGILNFESQASYQVTVRVTDSGGLFYDETLTININDVNEAPTAAADSFATNEEQTIGGDVLANDTDPEGDPLTAILVTGPSQAQSFQLNADGTFSYTPTANFFGTDSFTYQANDGLRDSAPITVTITIANVNDAPVGASDQFAATVNTVATITASVLANDFDIDSVQLFAVLVAPPLFGDLQLNGDGTFTYTPTPGFFGIDSFTYRPYDGSASGSDVVVQIEVMSTSPQQQSGGFTVAPIETVQEDESESTTDSEKDVAANVNSQLGAGALANLFNDRGDSDDDASTNEESLDASLTNHLLSALATADEREAAAVLDWILSFSKNLDRAIASEQLETNVTAGMRLAFNIQMISQQLDELGEQVDEKKFEFGNVEVAFAISTLSVTAGYLIWSLRGGMLLATFMTSLPSWQWIDPLPILESFPVSQRKQSKEELDKYFVDEGVKS